MKDYTEYWNDYEKFHFEMASKKAEDLAPCMLSAISDSGRLHLRIADIGTGTGVVAPPLIKTIKAVYTKINIDYFGFDLSENAIQKGKELFPEVKFFLKELEASDGPFDVVMYVDVLEHLENPYHALRVASQVGQYLVVRQPLLGNFFEFRHNRYKWQRETWGHINYFNYRSFIDMAKATGWEPLGTVGNCLQTACTVGDSPL